MGSISAWIAPIIYDGDCNHLDAALVAEDGRIIDIRSIVDLPRDAKRIDIGAEWLCPGFVDWQVNGGGGVLFNEMPTLETIQSIAMAHRRFGTTTVLPTVITDEVHVIEAACRAITEALTCDMPGIVGIHLEGPHIAVEKCGVHDPAFIRPMEMKDRKRLTRGDLGVTVATVAPENTTVEDIQDLAAKGVHVSLGHSNASFEAACQAFTAGASSVTLLFNAMSGLHHREPGLAGAALACPHVLCGLIADGHHVHPAMINLARAAKTDNGLTLVTDGMPTIGHEGHSFELYGRTINRSGGRLTTSDGTLAGADLDMMSTIRFMVEHTGTTVQAALRMASRQPARMLGLADRGHFKKGARADIVAFDKALMIQGVWIDGLEIEL